MKKWQKKLINISALCVATVLLCSAIDNKTNSNNTSNNQAKPVTGSPIGNQPLKVGIVSFKTCVEQSKIGKQEQASFEALKKQMESVLAEKEKSLNDMASKFNDADYLDSLSPEAETELKRKFRALNQEISQQQNQYLQTLQQTNFKVVQKLQELVTKAAQTIAKNEKLDLVLNEEGSFYSSPSLDISQKVIAILDQDFDKNPQGATESNKVPALK